MKNNLVVFGLCRLEQLGARILTVEFGGIWRYNGNGRGHGVMVTHHPSKVLLRVRIPLPALLFRAHSSMVRASGLKEGV